MEGRSRWERVGEASRGRRPLSQALPEQREATWGSRGKRAARKGKARVNALRWEPARGCEVPGEPCSSGLSLAGLHLPWRISS